MSYQTLKEDFGRFLVGIVDRYFSKSMADSRVFTSYHEARDLELVEEMDLAHAQKSSDEKRINGLENLITRQRARRRREKIGMQEVFDSLLNHPPYRRIPSLIAYKSGNVYSQNSASRKLVGRLKGVNLGNSGLDCAYPEKQEVELSGKLFVAYVLPLVNREGFDYSVVFFRPASAFGKIRRGIRKGVKITDREFERAVRKLGAEFAGINAQLDAKKKRLGLEGAT